MKKLIITESQMRFLNENDSVQLTGDGKEIKHFVNKLNPNSALDVVSGRFDSSDVDISDKTELVIDWSVLFLFTENGFDIKVNVNRVYGSLIFRVGEGEFKSIKIDSKNGYNLNVDSNFVDSRMNSDNFYVTIDLDNKTINI